MILAARLRPRRPERARHPWIFAGELSAISDGVADGDVVTVLDHRGEFFARAYCNRRSKIVLRVLTWHDEPVDDAWWGRRIAEAVARRGPLPLDAGRRLVNAEGDGLPGLIVDRYGAWLAVQISTHGVERVRDVIVTALRDACAPLGIYERSDLPERELEGLERRAGSMDGQPPPRDLEIAEGSARLLVDIVAGQKTGLFLDQRLNRAAAATYATGRSVLNCFAYSGGFSVHASLAGALEVISVDIAASACALAKTNMTRNGFADSPVIEANCFKYLRDASDAGKTFGEIILDPPAFARGKSTVEAAARGYKEINLRAIKMLEPGGVLVTCSCSRPLTPRDFIGIIWSAALDASRELQIIEERGQPPDHPALLNAPESSYLKCMILRAI